MATSTPPTAASRLPARPMLKPALPRLWRDEGTVQFGADPATALVVRGISPPVRRVLDLLDGTRDQHQLQSAAVADGVDPGLPTAVVARLASAGLLDDAAADASVLRGLTLPQRDRLAPELAALSLLTHAPGDALRLLARRRASTVAVAGPARLGRPIADLLTAAGVGAAAVLSTAAELVPDAGVPPPDLVVLTGVATLELSLVAAVTRLRAVHLAVTLRGASGVVGPLVVPGRTACLRCLDLHRADRDPDWPRLAMQLAIRRPAQPPGPAGLLAITAGTAALQALAHLEGEVSPPTLDGTLELTLPDWRIRRRSWSPHPDCCGGEEATDTR